MDDNLHIGLTRMAAGKVSKSAKGGETPREEHLKGHKTAKPVSDATTCDENASCLFSCSSRRSIRVFRSPEPRVAGMAIGNSWAKKVRA